MKARSQLLLIFFTAIAVLIITAFLLLSAITSKNKVLLEQGQVNLQKETDKVLSLRSLGFENWVNDNSFWDELISAYNNNDTLWVVENLGSSMHKFGADHLWLIKTDGSIFYNSAGTTEAATGNNFFMNHQLLVDSLKKNPFRNFFVSYNHQLLKISTAPVQPSTDTERKSPHRGYFIGAQVIDKNYLNNLSILTGENIYNVLPATSGMTETIDRQHSIVYYYKKFYGFDNNTLNILKVTQKLEVLSSYKKDLRNYLLIFVAIIMAIAIIVFYFFRSSIIFPLDTLSQSLEKRNDSLLHQLRNKRNEFGEMAMLITDFFKQNKLLQAEIETRIRSEKALQQSALELEHATVDKIRAEQAHLAKTEFLSVMSHEIRTPINGVVGVCNLLMEEQLTVRQKEYVDILNFSSQHLLSLVSDILDFSKIESGNMHFDKSSFDLKKTCTSIVDLYQAKANEKGITMEFSPDENVTFSLYGDTVRFCQIITNLLANAIKFTNQGRVTFSYTTISETSSALTLEFLVKDTGIGIGADKIDKIFESFTQADNTITSVYGGTGLGLTISKKLVELQGGKISVKSELGKGSEFIFYLSFEKHVYVDSLPNAQTSINNIKNLQGMKVLIVEDNSINAHVLGGFLKKWQIQFEVAVNGKEALDKLDESDFDMVLMDLQMPVMDGKECTQIIRSNEAAKYNKIPIIALTADATSQTQTTINKFGFNQYLSKPFSPDALYRLLKKHYSVYEN
jgi:signal transduction histidine kinase/ActR/RegA family two-component response regulator